MQTVEDCRIETIDELKEALGVIATALPAADIAESYETAVDGFQALACACLLLEGDAVGFQRHLFWAAFARRRFWQRLRDEGQMGIPFAARSRTDAFFCALATGDIPLAIELGASAPDEWIADGEHQDDFLYQLFLFHALREGDARSPKAVLDQWDEANAQPDPLRLHVCRALHDGDAAAFERGLDHLLSTERTRLAAHRLRSRDDPTVAPRSYVSVEGLGLAQLGRYLRVPSTRTEYPLCPGFAFEGSPRARPDDVVVEAERVGRR